MILDFSTHEHDCLALTEEFIRNSPTHQRARLRARWSVPIILSVGLLISVLSTGPNVFNASFFAIPIVAWLIFYPSRYDARVKRHAKAQMKESSYSKNFGDYSLELIPEAIVSTGPLGKSEQSWKAVDRVELTDAYLFVFFAGMSGLPIPVNQVGQAQAKAAFNLIGDYRLKSS